MRAWNDSVFSDMKLQASEVDSVEWWSVPQIMSSIQKQKSQPDFYTRSELPGEIASSSIKMFEHLKNLRYF